LFSLPVETLVSPGMVGRPAMIGMTTVVGGAMVGGVDL
jgi:hypothetical protein